MIPSKLNLSNFTSYGENSPTLDFSTFKMAAISGVNGAGKSSLLDAITWCLWGTSRAGDSADDLVRLGANDMQVELSFLLDSHEYTVKRRRVKKGGGSTSLELWSNSHNLTEGTIKATQQKIIDTLHLSFETFTNSSFLRQGHADEFTTKGPTDRKRILSDILGLSHYDDLEEKAKEKAKEISNKLQGLEYQLLEIEAELTQKEDRQKSLSLIEEEGKALQQKLKEKDLEIKEIEQKNLKIEKELDSLRENQERLDNLKKELQDLKSQVDLKRSAQAEYQEILDKKAEIEENYSKLEQLQEEKQKLEAKRSELIKVKDELVDLEKKLQDRENKRTEAISGVELQVKELQTIQEEKENHIKALRDNKSVCPTCGQEIKSEQNAKLISDAEKVISENSAKLKELKETILKYQSVTLPEIEQAKDKEIEVKKLEEETKDWFDISDKISSLNKYSDLNLKLQQASVAVKTQTEAITDLEKVINTREQELSKFISSDEELTQRLNQQREVNEEMERQIRAREDINNQVLDIRAKYGEAKQLVSRSEQLEQLLKEKQTSKKELSDEKEIYEELSLAFGKKGIQAMIIETAIPEIEEETNKLLDRLSEGKMKISFETQKETKTKTASGVDGKKERGLVETLDIIISDEMGERPYELYSGGEAFRVNIAIRLAISKLLTHRAGARLQFLVVDEGFGTQDAAGRARLVEVIDTIKDDFEKILIITHLEELKEEFPTRIEVSKNAGGSTFEVVGV